MKDSQKISSYTDIFLGKKDYLKIANAHQGEMDQRWDTGELLYLGSNPCGLILPKSKLVLHIKEQ